MKKTIQYTLLSVLFLSLQVTFYAQENNSWAESFAGGYNYRYIKNDPTHTRFYTLKNGLTVILSPSNKKPRIQTYIAVKAGSKTDPANHTGLAHYLEHMLFKGTDKFGSLDWSKEQGYISQIEALYEKYNSTKDEAVRKHIYHEIDSVSGIAAKYAIANEYDKMMSAMGAEGTNAFTSFEQTVYTEDIPSNVMDKYLTVQAERFRNPVFRLFHTELEAVYEEKNRSLDSDDDKVYDKMFELLFPHNNYGKQTTIGTIEHLKNPSLMEIRKYFNTYYVPNNMGIVMAGDFNPDEVIGKIDHFFSYMKTKEVPPYTFEPEQDLAAPLTAEVFGPEPPSVMLGYRFPGANSKDAQLLELIGQILSNGMAGLIDLDLVKQQKLLDAYSFPYILKDYSTLLLSGEPIKGQSLEDVKALLLAEIEKLKKGEFSDDLLTSIVNNAKKDFANTVDDYGTIAYLLMDNFVVGTDWGNQVNYVARLNALTKQDVVDFANRYFKNNYVAVFKQQGTDKNVQKVEKPTITPVEVNRKEESDFLKGVAQLPENKITPEWLDYKKDISFSQAGQYEVLAVKNKDNNLFDMYYQIETGSWGNKLINYACDYLEFLGTKDKSSETFSKEFYKLASSFDVYATGEKTYIHLEGLQENLEETVQKFDDLLKNCVADEAALKSYIARTLKDRANAKENRYQISGALRSYALYGANNPFNYTLSTKELTKLKADTLIRILHTLANYPQKILYHGPKSGVDLSAMMSKSHPAPTQFATLPTALKFERKAQGDATVLLANYNMVQAEIFWIRNADMFDEAMVPIASLFNEYFGAGMGTVVFQTIRESKALAYSTYAYFVNPPKKDQRMYEMAYVGTQSDKFNEAVDAMNELLTTLPQSEKSFENAQTSLTKKLASERTSGINIIFSYLRAQDLGRDYDSRKAIYEHISSFTFDDLNAFYNKEIGKKTYTYCVLAGKNKVSEEKLNSLGLVKKLSLKELFGY